MNKAFIAGLAVLALPVIAMPATAYAETITAHVNGMVCGFCAKSIQQTFSKMDAVQSVKVDLDKKVVVLMLKPKAVLADTVVTKKITDAGYKVTVITHAS